MTAIFETGGKQYRVNEGDIIYVEKLPGEADAEITFPSVLVIVDGENVYTGQPFVDGAQVTAKIVKQGKAKKVIVYKMKPKKNYRRKQGHRQPYTKLQIQTISAQPA